MRLYWLPVTMTRIEPKAGVATPAQVGVRPRVYLSPPHLTGDEQRLVADAFESNWIAPLGPHVDAFEREFAATVGAQHAVALASGTAAIHLGLAHLGVGPGDTVIVSSLTFSASANPVVYLGAQPVFIDSELASWNLDPDLLEEALAQSAKEGKLPKAVIPVHLYGQSADMDRIMASCRRWGVPVLEDAAEALGATYKGKAPGTFGDAGVFSFNGNKVISTSGGGMLVTDDAAVEAHVRKLATQAREATVHYEHTEIGYNYRLSNVCAAIGRGQLMTLEQRVQARRRNYALYVEGLADLPGITFMPEAPWGRHSRWLTTLTIDPALFGADREEVRLALEAEDIESRPVWKPMHMQPVFKNCRMHGGRMSERVFKHGLCLPSGSNLGDENVARVIEVVRRLVRD